ncbi:Hydroxypyruvate reductase [Neomoorella glycerini]|uniref:Hydroxypyruvate reductase n=1 Tax=Neomoorella glycerini TaxID=55779 RepID=A0A6I5ZQ34_9FIRM|nr:phosphoglycerate dehydrogenase [Moorella glycerini]QGP92053.1 Hydroxypyruvate reductase [Moorella glycerini]
MGSKILITPRSYLEIRAEMKELLEGYQVVFNERGRPLSEREMVELVPDVNGILVGVDPVTAAVMEAAPKLKAISKYGAGMDNIDLAAAARRGIKVQNTPGTNRVAVAELTIGLMFDLSRHISHAVAAVKRGRWERVMGVELAGKTLGLIGCGNIGREVARRARGLEMNVLVYDPYFSDDGFASRYQLQVTDLVTLLSQADYVSLHLPLSATTAGIIGRNELAMMKNTACLINTSRGALVKEDDLLWALRTGVIAGAAMDVFWREPAGEHELLQLDNFILTPHMGAHTREAVIKTARAATENLLAMLA